MAKYPQADRLMAGELGQWLHAQTEVRQDAKRKANDRLWKAAMVAGPIYAFLAILLPIDVQAKFFVGAIAAGAIWVWSQGPKREAVKQVKTGINEAIASALGLQYQHDLRPGRGFEAAKGYQMVPKHDRAGFEDMWSGDYAGHPFVLHEAHLEERRGSGKNQRWVTVFRGSILSLGFKRPFHGTTLVTRAGRHKSMFGFGGRKASIKVDGKKLDVVDMVHPDFEDSFDVYSNDQVEARAIVHPAYIERLIAIEKAFAGEDICSLFDKGQLVVTLNCGNLFESGSIEASDDEHLVATTIEQFARLADLAESLQEAK